LVLEFLLKLEWDKGARKGKLDHAGICRVTVPPTRLRPLEWGCPPGAGAIWEDAVTPQW